MQVRRLGPDDAAAATEVCRLFDLRGRLDPSRFLARDDVHLLVAEIDGRPVGWVYGQELLHPDGEVTALLYSLDVAAGARRQGVGRALTERFVDVVRRRGCSEAWVLTEPDNAAAQATYRSAGGRPEDEPSVMLVWTLGAGNEAGGLPG
ncbi:GNAT family N-acetyltransferase [Nakamurella endophytica]|uniref:N-acetyltransferase n=1 Tax=Nakamurella endophytica TaxID=1748367 RepID=A0A917WBC3_9ACTN|nr:GNAT family N-acetyltransferase [Nakamurella endophytica]GGL88273.1 N-acetyltransferase [Nakamurella endophytica]